MRIGIDGRLWNETGVGRYIRNLVKELQEIDDSNDYVLFVGSETTQRFKIEDLRFKNNFKIITTDIRWHTVAEQTKFPQVLYKENLDLMHFSYFSVPISYNKPFVVTIHDLIIHYHGTGKSSTLPLPLYYAKKFGYKYVLRNAVRKAKKVIVPLQAVKADILKFYSVPEDKIVVTYEGVDKSISNFKFHTPRGASISNFKSKKYFLYVGNAYPHKNLEKLIEAFGLFRKEIGGDVKLLLVGKDDYFYRRLEEKVRIENISGVLVVHDVNDRELANLYAGAIALVSPSLMEGFGLPPLEAMALGCLLLLSDIPSFREVCKDIPFYCNPREISDIKERMKFVYEIDQKTKREHIEKGLERVKEFSWKRMAEETLQIYNSTDVISKP